MTQDHHGDTPLATSTRRRCHACGLPTPTPLLRGAADEGLCPSCWLRSRWPFEGDHRQQLLEALAQRVRIGQRLGNGRRVTYPAELDGHLICRLEAIRRHLVRVEVTVASDCFDQEHRIVEGHLRRYGPVDTELGDFQFDLDLIGLFQNVDDREPTDVLDGRDFGRIVRVELTDPLLLGRHDPVVLWNASSEKMALHAERQKASFVRELRRAKLFLLHAFVVGIAWLALLVPVVFSFTSGSQWRAFVWMINFVVLGFLLGMTLALWDPTPTLSTLRTARDARD